MKIILPLSIPDGRTREKINKKTGAIIPERNKFVYPAPSLNVQIRESMFVKIRRKAVIKKLLEKMNLQPISGAFDLKYTRFCISKLDQVDNMGASLKNIIDVLVEEKYLGDDDDRFVKNVKPKQKKVSKREHERIEITITPATPYGKAWATPYSIKRRDAFLNRKRSSTKMSDKKI